jgi:hypothetical protein
MSARPAAPHPEPKVITHSHRSFVASFRQADEAIRIILLAVLVLVMGSTARAQETASTTATMRMPWPAPVGHRQPRPADIPVNPATKPAKDAYDIALDRLNRAADGSLRICRGC